MPIIDKFHINGRLHRPKAHCRVVQGTIREAKAEHQHSTENKAKSWIQTVIPNKIRDISSLHINISRIFYTFVLGLRQLSPRHIAR